jgi:hypothetical protein
MVAEAPFGSTTVSELDRRSTGTSTVGAATWASARSSRTLDDCASMTSWRGTTHRPARFNDEERDRKVSTSGATAAGRSATNDTISSWVRAASTAWRRSSNSDSVSRPSPTAWFSRSTTRFRSASDTRISGLGASSPATH